MTHIGLIDTGINNLASVRNAFERIGQEIHLVVEARDLTSMDALVLPGVGAFRDGIGALKGRNLAEGIIRKVRSGAPLLGICLGMQMLADYSVEHGRHDGLGLIKGGVQPLVATQPGFRVPNIGWSEVTGTRPSTLFPSPGWKDHLYFLHSYHFVVDDPSAVVATFDFSGGPIVAAVEDGPVFGMQCHPEKSQDAGMDGLKQFVAYVHRRQMALAS